jgi:hypothetical protein
MEKHRTEVTEVTEGKLGVVDERAWVNTAGFRARTREWKSIAQRTRRSQRDQPIRERDSDGAADCPERSTLTGQVLIMGPVLGLTHIADATRNAMSLNKAGPVSTLQITRSSSGKRSALRFAR